MGTNKHKQEEETFSEKYSSSYNCIYVYNFMSLGFNLLVFAHFDAWCLPQNFT